MSAVIEWLPLWLRVALAVAVFLLGSIVLLAAYQAARIITVMALEACSSAAINLVDRLTVVFVEAVLGLARRIRQLVRAAITALFGFVRVTPVAAQRQPQQRVPPRPQRTSGAQHRAAGGAKREPPGGQSGAKQTHARSAPPPPPPPPPPRPDPRVAYQAACRLFGLPPSGFTREQLNKVFRSRIHAAHPDRGGNHEQAAALAAARDLIRNWHGWGR
jgi:hypothetical protein